MTTQATPLSAAQLLARDAGISANGVRPQEWLDDTCDGLPMIQVNARQLPDVTAQALAAVVARNDPARLFVRSGRLTRLVEDEHGRLAAELVGVSSGRGILARSAGWLQVSERSTVAAPPPRELVDDFLSLGSWTGIPRLASIVSAPVLTAAGQILRTPGYDAGSGLYLADTGLDLPPIDTTPQGVAAAARLLRDELVGEFPFVDDSSWTNAVALQITPFVRPYTAGPVPLTLIDSPKAGTGKSLLATVCAIPFAPAGPDLMVGGRDDEEWRKRLTSVLLASRSHVLVDNIRGKLDFGVLAAVITAYPYFSDRALGSNTLLTLPQAAVFTATGNNLSLSDEIARRSVWVRLDAKAERPWTGRTFSHEPLVDWARENRSRLVAAILTLIQAWLDAGRPAFQGYRPGMFERWADVVGGILQVAEVPGFLENATELYESLDPDSVLWAAFLTQWWETHGSEAQSGSKLLEVARSAGDALSDLGVRAISDAGHGGLKQLGRMERPRTPVDGLIG